MFTTYALATDDLELITDCASIIDTPKAAPPDSFVLHAPLELLARALLLTRMPVEDRTAARRQMRRVADAYADAGPPASHDPEPLDCGIDRIVTSLAAAGHAPILLDLRPQVPSVPTTFG